MPKLAQINLDMPATRSHIMSKIRSKDTKPEVTVRKFLHKNGLRFKLHDKSLSGTPDIVLPRHNAVIFVHGCFWHSHGCTLAAPPKSNLSYWIPKLERIVQRSDSNIKQLQEEGWRIFVIWECDLMQQNKDVALSKLLEYLRNN